MLLRGWCVSVSVCPSGGGLSELMTSMENPPLCFSFASSRLHPHSWPNPSGLKGCRKGVLPPLWPQHASQSLGVSVNCPSSFTGPCSVTLLGVPSALAPAWKVTLGTPCSSSLGRRLPSLGSPHIACWRAHSSQGLFSMRYLYQLLGLDPTGGKLPVGFQVTQFLTKPWRSKDAHPGNILLPWL